jgi:uncharacterized protein
MQNKPNFRRAKMNASIYSYNDYEGCPGLRFWKNKAKQSQFSNRKTDDRRQKPAPSTSSGQALSEAEGTEFSPRSFRLRQGYAGQAVLCAWRLLIGRMKPLCKPGNEQYYSQQIGRCSSTVEHGFRKAGVEGPNPSIGCMNPQEKYNQLRQILKELGRVVVAYSGGVDSTLLLKVAVDTLGAENVLACISTGAAEPQKQFDHAARIAKDIGVELLPVEADELADNKFTANRPDRCFHCKLNICKTLLEIAEQRGFGHVIFGSNADDQRDFRPGIKALRAYKIRSPLAEAGLTKDEIRQLSRRLNLVTAELPSNPCLASRIPYGLEITEERLRQIDKAEDFLQGLGFVEVRVRHHDTIARIEVAPQDIAKLTAEPLRSRIVEKLKSLGFKFVTVDLQGFRSGSLNEPLSEQEKQKNLE